MTNKKILTWSFIGVGVILLGVGVWQFAKRQIYLIQQYCYKIVGGKVNKFTTKEIDILINVKFQNNSDVAFEIKKIALDVDLMGKYASSLVIDKIIQVPSKKPIVIPLNIKFNPNKFIKLDYLLEMTTYYLLGKKELITLGIKGKASITKVISINDFEFDFSTNLKEILTPAPADDNKFDYCKEFK